MSATMETPPRLKLDRVSKLFGGVHALTDLSLEVAPRQIVGVIGPNGAGKTTTFNVITGAYRASSGAVMLDGHAVTDRPSHQIARAGIMRTFQNIRLFADMTVWEHLLVAQPPTGSAIQRLLPTRLANPLAIARAKEPMCGCATSRCSQTVMSENRRMFWKVRMMPARAILCDGSDVTA